MILLTNQVLDKNEAQCVLKVEQSKIYMSFDGKGEFVFDNELVGFKPDVAYLGYDVGSRDFFLSWSSEIAETRDGSSYVYLRNKMHLEHNNSANLNLATIWAGSTPSVRILGPCYVESADCEIKECSYGSGLTILANNIPEVAEYVNRINAKRALLRKVNELNSLAMIEAQLDLLTKHVLQSLPNSELEATLQGICTTDIHNEQKLLQTIKNQKTHLRNIQKEYFATRGNSINSDPSA